MFRLVAIATFISLGISFVSLLPTYMEFLWSAMVVHLPRWIVWPLGTFAWFFALALISVPLAKRPSRIGRLNVSPVFWERLDGVASWLLRGRLAAVLALCAALMLATWVPHYLTWPWWADTDYFAVAAQSWDAGILPYRDLYDFNFPGPIYVHWLIGKAVGWGHTVPFYALDSALLIGFGVALAAWGRDRFGSTIPGLVGYLGFLSYYLSLNYSLVAQRDWHATLLTVFALILLEARRDRLGLVGSALAFAAALTVRPHPVVLLPALLSAIDENSRQVGEPWRRTVKAVALWSVIVGLGLLAGFAPVVLAGVMDDFVYWFKLAWYGGLYNRSESRSFASVLFDQLGRWETGVILVGLTVMVFGMFQLRRTARTWLLALLFILFYKPLSPVLHDYLNQPSILVWSVALGVVTGGAMLSLRSYPVIQLLTAVVIAAHAVPQVPVYCRIFASLRSVGDLASGEYPLISPPGCENALPHRLRRPATPYAWEEYVAVLTYLRQETGPQTRIANFLTNHPFPTLNGPVGRLRVFPSPGGVLWLRYAAPGLEVPFVEALVSAKDSVVVWAPSLKPGGVSLRLERLEQIIPKFYEPEAKFGTIEVWRRRPSPQPEPPADVGASIKRRGEQVKVLNERRHDGYVTGQTVVDDLRFLKANVRAYARSFSSSSRSSTGIPL